MAGLPWPGSSEFDAESWDTVLLGGRLLPGICRVDVSGELDVDKGKAGDKHGANLKVKGFQPRTVSITWEIWDRGSSDEQKEQTLREWEEMQAATEEWEPVDGKAPTQPLAIFNIKTAARRVYSVLVTKIQGPDYKAGVMTVKLSCLEWNPPTKKAPAGVGKAKAEKTSAPGSEWEQAPNENGEITTTATKSSPSKTNTAPKT